MKFKIVIIISFLVVSCNTRNQKEEVISEFISEFFISDAYNIKEVDKYMTSEYIKKYKSLSQKEKEIHLNYLKMLIDEISKEIKQNYIIMRSNKMDLNLLNKYKVSYEGKGDIYYILNNDIIITFFIMIDDKIISFCPDIYNDKKNVIVPYYFFENIE